MFVSHMNAKLVPLWQLVPIDTEICILPVPVTLSKMWRFVPNLLFFFVVPVNKYRISCKLDYNLIDFCKFLTKEDFSFRFYIYNAKINDIIANVMVSP